MYDPFGVKFLTYVTFQFSYLNEYNFKDGFDERINPIILNGWLTG